jgi:hypothetical protein
VAKVARVSQILADFGFQKARKPKPKPAASKSTKGRKKDPAEVFDGMVSNFSKLKALKGSPSRQPLGPDGVPIYTGMSLNFTLSIAFFSRPRCRLQAEEEGLT